MKTEKEEDDEIVCEYDVFITQALNPNLHVFQYPLRQSNEPYEHNDVALFCTQGVPQSGSGSGSGAASTPKSKPSSGGFDAAIGSGAPPGIVGPASRFTMHCFLDAFDSESFDRERMPVGASDASTEDTKSKYHYVLASQPFQGRSDYAVGLLKGHELHITPISTIQQFTPVIRSSAASISASRDLEDIPLHMRKKVIAEREALAAVGPRTVEDAHASQKVEDAVVGGPIGEIVNRQMRRLRSVALNTDAKNSTRLEFYSRHSVESRGIVRRLLCTTSMPAASQVGGIAPVQAYFPADPNAGGSTTNLAKRITTRFASDHSVVAQVKDLMASAQVLPLATVRRMIRPTSTTAVSKGAALVTDQQLIEGLRQCAAFMHGVWVAKTNEEFRGTNAALREIVLAHFSRSPAGAVRRADITALFNRRVVAPLFLSTTLKEVLSSVADLTANPDPEKRVWQLRGVPTFEEQRAALVAAFQNDFPIDFQFQQQYWIKRSAAIASHVDVINAGKVVRQLFLIGQTQSDQPAAHLSTAGGSARPTGLTINTAAPSSTAFSSTDPLIVSIRQFVRRIFIEHGVINKQRVKELLLRNKEASFPTATGPAFLFAVNEECQTFTPATFVLRSIDREVDKFRPDFLRVAAEMATFDSKALVQRVSEHMAQEQEAQGQAAAPVAIPASVATRIISEIAEYKQGERLWHVKSGNI